MPKISIIIRSKNEEKWIGHCLSAVFSQKCSDFEVILVDNESSDNTVEIASRYPISKVVNVEYFLPGLAINQGIRISSGEYIVCLSAHCVPQKDDWLCKLSENLDGNENVAGVYGRQLPVSFTDAVDKRDLLIAFGEDKRVQIKDYFFHNANSMIKRHIWDQFPFDEKVTNIEDRVWGKQMVKNGYKLIYEPEASVFHHHGLHQGNNPERAKGVISVIETVDQDLINELPCSMQPEHSHVDAVVPIKDGEIQNNSHAELLGNLILSLKSSKFIKDIYILSSGKSLAEKHSVKFIDRRSIINNDSLSLDQLMKNALSLIEKKKNYPDSLIYLSHDYLFRPENIFDDLIKEQKVNGYDCVFPGLIDFSHYWAKNEFSDYKQNDDSMISREKRSPNYKALYGIGCLTSSWMIRKGEMIGGKIGILPLQNARYGMRRRENDYALIYEKLKLQGTKFNFNW
jgi:glycosyltransferase involved in cell wall biosynthesis